MKRLMGIGLAALACAALSAGGCATKESGPAWVVVEPNAEIFDRHLIRRMSVIEDDTLLIEEGAGRYYRVKLFPACLSFDDILAPVRIEEIGIGVDRGTRFIVEGRRCPVRSIDRVERAPRTPAEEAAPDAEAPAQPAPESS